MRGESARATAWADEAPTRLSERPREGQPRSGPQIECRSTERFQIDVEVSLTSESHFFAGLSGDMVGLFVQTYRAHPVGSRVLVALSLPLGEVRAPGTVRWIRGTAEETAPGLGIAFERLSTAEHAWIEAFCASRPPFYHDLEPD
jgi:hypothetical protein